MSETNINKKAHEEAFSEILAVSKKYGIDIITILDEDIFDAINVAKENGAENTDELLTKLTPQVCKNIRDDFIERMCDQWAQCLEEAINSQINSGDEDEEETSEEGNNDA